MGDKSRGRREQKRMTLGLRGQKKIESEKEVKKFVRRGGFQSYIISVLFNKNSTKMSKGDIKNEKLVN